MTTGAAVFVDTNVLIYASRPKAPEHDRAQAALTRLGQDACALWLSQQILREYLAASTRPQPFGAALPMTAAIADTQRFRSAFNIADDGPETFDQLLRLLATSRGGGKQVHDANIVATMLTRGIGRLLTFNVADFQSFGGVIELVAP